MSTNHRPQLESKRGKVIKIKDSIKHARALPQQKSLKYRQDIPSTISGKEEETKEDKESESEESDSDSDDETALLLQEIEKIRQEKLENDKDQNESKVVAIKPGSSTKKKSWRSTTTFNNNKSKQAKEEKKYSTDSLDSEYHQKLMSKYIR
ncbi:Pre-mRNA-splicing factor CWC15 [Candida tropicalis]